ncbi:hypothetical protein AAX29_00634 [Aliarcobacter thereius]|uniref:HNH endonuclease n=1 Tax=Aliarcobacter thereius TaxID=544718 RepID=A0A1C0B7K8_9BACT|nr:hypothetical protein [Aliarcobacter thereius]OCL99589.1 hypothetical protein AAX29_00634 [Aliarcobacter thereius]
MPTKIDIPNINDIQLLSTIIQERLSGSNANYFSNYQSNWLSRYNEYITNSGNPENILDSNIATEHKNKFINLYEKKPNSIGIEIIKPLNKHELSLCPFCSEAGKPNTLDHFLPKNTYPEFSILSKNLVPACDACQKINAKGSKVFNLKGKRLFLHPYYDIPLDIEIFKIKILKPFETGHKYKLFINKDLLDKNLRKIAIRHIRTLNIHNRFKEFYSKEYLRKKDLIKDIINICTITELSKVKEIVNSFYLKEKSVGINYWDTIIYKAFLDNDELLEFILNS